MTSGTAEFRSKAPHLGCRRCRPVIWPFSCSSPRQKVGVTAVYVDTAYASLMSQTQHTTSCLHCLRIPNCTSLKTFYTWYTLDTLKSHTRRRAVSIKEQWRRRGLLHSHQTQERTPIIKTLCLIQLKKETALLTPVMLSKYLLLWSNSQ